MSAVSPQPDAGLRGGLRSPDLLHVVQALWPVELRGEVAPLEGFQPPTTRSEVERSDALSYSGAWKGVPVLPRLLRLERPPSWLLDERPIRYWTDARASNVRGAVACGRNPTAPHRALRWGRAPLRHPYRSPPPLPASSRVDSCLVVELPGIAPGLPRCERGVILVDYSPRLEPLTGFEPILVLYESTVPPSTLERHVVALAGFEPATCSL